MEKKTFLRVEAFSLIGLVICTYSLLFGAWVKRPVGPDISGFELWQSLRLTLSSPEFLPEVTVQQAVFSLLSVLIVSLIVQAMVTAILFSRPQPIWGSASVALWALSLLSTGTMFLKYDAVVSGVMLMGVGCITALGCELLVIYLGGAAPRSDHAAALPKAAKAWTAALAEARGENIPLAVLALAAEPTFTLEELPQLQRELRGRDLIFPVRNGLFILLWQTSPANAPQIAAKLQNVLQAQSGRQAKIGMACFPADGNNLEELLSCAVQALQSARQAGGPAIVSHSDPGLNQALTSLASWEGLLAEAGAAQIPAIVLSFNAGRMLNARELSLIQQELRGNDRVSVFEKGCYVLLWKTSAEGGKVVQAKIQQILLAAGVECQSALAAFPADGSQLTALLERLQ